MGACSFCNYIMQQSFCMSGGSPSRSSLGKSFSKSGGSSKFSRSSGLKPSPGSPAATDKRLALQTSEKDSVLALTVHAHEP